MSKASCGDNWPWYIETFQELSDHGESVVDTCVIIMGADEESIIADHVTPLNAERIMAAMKLLEAKP